MAHYRIIRSLVGGAASQPRRPRLESPLPWNQILRECLSKVYTSANIRESRKCSSIACVFKEKFDSVW